MIVILDNGHGVNTPGKCSPDRSLLEYKWSRDIVNILIKNFTKLGIKAVALVPEDTDISLSERVRRANQIYKDNNRQAILISIHCNAAGIGDKWCNASGWSVFVSPNASSKSKRLAQLLYNQAEKRNLQGNRYVPEEKYWTQSLYICKHTNCPAVLTENMFQDNKKDAEFLLSEEGKQQIIDLHITGVLDYLNEQMV